MHTHLTIPYRGGFLQITGNATTDLLLTVFRSNERFKRRHALITHLKQRGRSAHA